MANKDYKKEFEKVFKEALKEHVKPIDQLHIQNLCDLYVTFKTAYDKLQKEGYVVSYPNGTVGISQWNTVYLKNLKQFNDLARDYGLTPLSKANLDRKLQRNAEGEILDEQDQEMEGMFTGK